MFSEVNGSEYLKLKVLKDNEDHCYAQVPTCFKLFCSMLGIMFDISTSKMVVKRKINQHLIEIQLHKDPVEHF